MTANKTALGKFGYSNPRSKAVQKFTKNGILVAEYGSAHEAMRKTGIGYSFIAAACRGDCNSARGFKWKYANPKSHPGS